MNEEYQPTVENSTDPIAFQTEVKQLLNILIHSLYTEKEIFLRELISNASDALTQMRFVQQTERDYRDPDAELKITVSVDPDEHIIEVRDTGVGMTREDARTNLGTIAQSGARAFLQAIESEEASLEDVIGKFGVGFYSVFMVAEWVKVISRSYQPDADPVSWFATGSDTFQLGEADREERGTTIIVKLKEDASEFASQTRVRQIIKRHSDYVAYPIYLDEEEEQVNRQKAIWRQRPSEVDDEEYSDFYKQMTFDFTDPLAHIHFVADAPLKIFALLYLPSQVDQGMFSLGEENGLRLYARKVLIEEEKKELLPPYYRFVKGVVDAEDLPLNVSRESVQANAVMSRLKGILTNQVNRKLTSLAKKDPETYLVFWDEFGQFIKEGVASDEKRREALIPLLRFKTTTHPKEWTSLDEYLARMPDNQEKIYYILGDDAHSVSRSPHLDYFQSHCYEVLILTDPVDSFMVMGLRDQDDYELQNVAASDLELPSPREETEKTDQGDEQEEMSSGEADRLVERFKAQLGEQVSDVRTTTRLTSSAARLVDPEGALGQEMQRMYRMMDRDFQIPAKVLELNPAHPIMGKLAGLDQGDPLSKAIIEQIYENAMLIEGIHPDPASMISRIDDLMEAALEK
jgi:molecular chaperone HtpG